MKHVGNDYYEINIVSVTIRMQLNILRNRDEGITILIVPNYVFFNENSENLETHLCLISFMCVGQFPL